MVTAARKLQVLSLSLYGLYCAANDFDRVVILLNAPLHRRFLSKNCVC